jgi:hypothetical protein
MEVGLGPNEGCSPKEKKMYIVGICRESKAFRGVGEGVLLYYTTNSSQ